MAHPISRSAFRAIPWADNVLAERSDQCGLAGFAPSAGLPIRRKQHHETGLMKSRYSDTARPSTALRPVENGVVTTVVHLLDALGIVGR